MHQHTPHRQQWRTPAAWQAPPPWPAPLRRAPPWAPVHGQGLTVSQSSHSAPRIFCLKQTAPFLGQSNKVVCQSCCKAEAVEHVHLLTRDLKACWFLLSWLPCAALEYIANSTASSLLREESTPREAAAEAAAVRPPRPLRWLPACRSAPWRPHAPCPAHREALPPEQSAL